MNFCPEKPGTTLITSTMSTSSNARKDRLDRRRRPQRDADMAAHFPQLLRRRRRIFNRLDMKRDAVGTRLHDRRSVSHRLGDHQVRIEVGVSHTPRPSTIAGPKLMFGTKWPSITSR